ncbi:MAG: ComEC/Rec2 family competence protein [Tepidiformaceae bacterium]
MTLVVLALAWLAAMVAVGLWDAPWWMVGAWLVAGSPVVFRAAGRRACGLILVGAALALAGGARFEGWHERPVPALAVHIGEELTLDGVVSSEPDPGQVTTSYEVAVTRIEHGGETRGKVRLTLSQFAELRRGQRVLVRGKLEAAPVFDDFDYRGLLLRRGVVGTMLFPQVEIAGEPSRWDPRPAITGARLDLEDALARSLPEPEASLGAGIAFGRDSNIPDELYEDFRRTGLAHIVAVSGTNVALVAALTFFLLTPAVGRRAAVFPAGAAIVAYVLMAGLSASVVRAGIMAVVFLVGAWLGRQRSALAALGAAAIVMTAISPAAAQEAGFQLSLAATAGLIVFGPWLKWAMDRALAAHPITAWVPGWVTQVAALSLSATIATTPIIWATFGRVSLIGPLANVVVEPVFVLAFWGAALTAVAAWVWEPAGWTMGLVAYYPLGFITWFADAAARVPGASVAVPPASATWAALAYIVLGIAAWPAYRYLVPALVQAPQVHGAAMRRMAIGGVATATLAAVLPITLLPIGGSGRLEVTVLDIGQGDAILVSTPHGKRLLVDGGPSSIEVARQLGATLPHWERRIEAVFLTHPQQDHMAGLPEVFDRFRVGRTFDTGVTSRTEAFAAYEQHEGRYRRLSAGERLVFDGVTVEVLWPPADYRPGNVNETSLVLRLTYGSTTFLLAGDIEAAAQRALMAAGEFQADVLKVPHHGSATSDPAFLRAAGAALAIISVGEGNRFGHPREEALAALGDGEVLRTDLHGRITVKSDGQRVTVRTERR